MLKNLLLVGAGSFIGGIVRYLVSLMIKTSEGSFPWATFLVNIAGCLLIGLIWGWSSRNPNFSENLMLLLSVGFCGGFTTFSTFSKEGVALLQSCNITVFLLYSIGSVILGLLAATLGFLITK